MAQMNRFGGDQRGGLNEDMFLWFSAFSTVSAVHFFPHLLIVCLADTSRWTGDYAAALNR